MSPNQGWAWCKVGVTKMWRWQCSCGYGYCQSSPNRYDLRRRMTNLLIYLQNNDSWPSEETKGLFLIDCIRLCVNICSSSALRWCNTKTRRGFLVSLQSGGHQAERRASGLYLSLSEDERPSALFGSSPCLPRCFKCGSQLRLRCVLQPLDAADEPLI